MVTKNDGRDISLQKTKIMKKSDKNGMAVQDLVYALFYMYAALYRAGMKNYII